jgi:hypothetical protein
LWKGNNGYEEYMNVNSPRFAFNKFVYAARFRVSNYNRNVLK